MDLEWCFTCLSRVLADCSCSATLQFHPSFPSQSQMGNISLSPYIEPRKLVRYISRSPSLGRRQRPRLLQHRRLSFPVPTATVAVVLLRVEGIRFLIDGDGSEQSRVDSFLRSSLSASFLILARVKVNRRTSHP